MPAPKIKTVSPLQQDMRLLKVSHILREAGALFIERGFVQTTMDAIAERLDVSKPFIYQFFKTKHALLVALYDAELRDSLATLGDASLGGGTPPDRLANFIQVAVRKNVKNQGLTAMLALEEKHLPKAKMAQINALEDQFNQRLTAIIKDGVEAGAFNARNPALASRAIMGMLQWVKRWYRNTGDLGVETVAAEFSGMAMRMLNANPFGPAPAAPAAPAAPQPAQPPSTRRAGAASAKPS